MSDQPTAALRQSPPSLVRTRTFRRKALEADFLKFCQLHTEAEAQAIEPDAFDQLRGEAENFIHSHDFTSRSAEAILGTQILDACPPETSRASNRKLNLPAHLASMCEEKLLAADQERQLFQRMNFLRYRASRIIEGQTHHTLSQWDHERTLGLLKAAEWHRDLIVRANVRLVISIVKKFVNPQCGFDDLLSDGIMALIRSVDKFDYQLGFRFSTYATQVVRRNSYRFVMDRQEERHKTTNSFSDQCLDVPIDQRSSSMSEQRWHTLRSSLRGYLDLLDKREKLIIRARFSLGSHRRVQTLQKLANRLGISKERVRQLEKRALEKLQVMATECPPDVVEVEA